MDAEEYREKIERDILEIRNTEFTISLLYQAICIFSGGAAPSGALNALLFEPVMAHFNFLMITLQESEEF